MKIYSVFDPEYRPYGKVLEDYDTLELTAAMQKIPMPGAGGAACFPGAFRPGLRRYAHSAGHVLGL